MGHWVTLPDSEGRRITGISPTAARRIGAPPPAFMPTRSGPDRRPGLCLSPNHARDGGAPARSASRMS
jgi:hypothetical protein